MFANIGTYPPVGLFSNTHIITICVCFVCVGFAVWLTRKMTKETYFKCLKIFAIVLTILEIFKIVWTISIGETRLDSWFPLYFCSLFLYALWFAVSKNDHIKNMGLSFIAIAALIAGVVFIIMPTTSFNLFPIFHFQSIYSMLFHSLMVYSEIMLYVTKSYKLNLKSVGYYFAFCAMFMIIAIGLNSYFGSNMMFLRDPAKIPIPLLFTIKAFSPSLFTLTMAAVYTLVMGFGMLGIYKLIETLIKKKTK